MKHVALLVPTLDQLGGAERQVMLLAQGLMQRGWRVSVIALSGTGGERGAMLSAAGITFLSLKMRKGWADLRGWRQLRKWIGAERPDVLHAHLPHAVWMARWIRIIAPVRVVVETIHTSAIGPESRQRGYRWSNWLTDQTTAVSRDVAKAYTAAEIVHEDKLTIVPNGVDATFWGSDSTVRSRIRREEALEGKFVWFAAGRLEAVKDYASLLYAVSALDNEALLAIAGDGALRDGLERLAEQLGIHTRVRFLGFVENPLRWMRAADGYVLTSRWEGLPMSILEAGACGLPVVATDVEGTRELIAPGHTGLLAESGNVLAIAASMKRVMEMNQSERAAMGDYARKQVLEHYALDPVLNQWEKLFEELLLRNPAPRRWASTAHGMHHTTGEAAPTT